MSDDGPHWRLQPNGRQYTPITRKGWTQLLVWVALFTVMTLAFTFGVGLNPKGSTIAMATVAYVVATVVMIVMLVRVIKRGL